MCNSLGEYVKQRRQAMGLSLREFGKLCGMSHTHIDSIEKGFDVRSGRPVNLTSATLKKLSETLGVGETELMNLYFGKNDGLPMTDDMQLKLALFGNADVSDGMLDEVRRFAKFLMARDVETGEDQ